MTYTAAWCVDGAAETLWANPDATVCIVAPHGGDIEYGTDDCAARIHKRLRATGIQPTTWMYHGWGEDAFDRYHISSNRLAFDRFDKLGRLSDRRFQYAVAVHMHNEDYNAVGGQADEAIRRRIVDHLDDELPKENRYRHGEMRYAGEKDSNIVNRLTADGGSSIQLELTPKTCYIYRKRVARAVTDVVAELI